MKKRILISVTDKTGLEKFKRLTDLGWEVLSTGGTFDHLVKLGIPCTLVFDVTGFPEIMGGRVKTLHPRIFAGILANRSNPEHMATIAEFGIEPIDLVIVNLYDFNGKPGIEEIDIGGPSLLRAAAKNGAHVVAVVDPRDYDNIIFEIEKYGEILIKTKEVMALNVFNHTSKYDLDIYNWMYSQMLEVKDFLAP